MSDAPQKVPGIEVKATFSNRVYVTATASMSHYRLLFCEAINSDERCDTAIVMLPVDFAALIELGNRMLKDGAVIAQAQQEAIGVQKQ